MQDRSGHQVPRNISAIIVAATLIACAQPGYAAVDADAAAPSTATAPPAAESGEPAGMQLEEITVTAEKRSENIQRAPVAITSVTGAALNDAGIDNIRGFQTILVNANFERQNDFTQLYVRGIGQNQDSDYIDSGTAMYFNDMYTSRAFAASIGFYDIGTVQLLPGPQGTLYGRNALGGAILINANRPTNEYQTAATLELGNFNLVHATAVQNVPLTDSVSIRMAVDSESHQGYLSNGADDLGAIGARLGGLYKLGDQFSVYAWGSYYHNSGSAEIAVTYPFNHSNPNFTGSAWDVPAPPSPVAPGGPGTSFQTGQAGGLEATWNLGDITISSISSLFSYESDNKTFLLFFPFEEINSEHEFTQELRASSTSGPISWVAGLYYLHFVPFQQQFGLTVTARDESYAAYGNLTYSVTDRLRLTGGLRYSDDKKTGFGVNPSADAFDFEHTWNHTDWKAGIDFDLTQSSLLYGSVQTGYMEGTFLTQPNTPTFNNLIKPETVRAFTIGSKNRFFNNRLQLNDEAFYYKLNDLQLTQLDPVGGITFVANSNVTIWGDELSATVLLTDNDQLTTTAGYLHARYDEFPGLVGQQTIFAPDLTASVGYQHIFKLDNGARVIGRLDSHYSSSFWGSLAHDPNTEQFAYTKTDMSMTYYSANDKWNVGAWVKNVENVAVWNSGGSLGPNVFSFPQAPRTYGVRFRTSF